VSREILGALRDAAVCCCRQARKPVRRAASFRASNSRRSRRVDSACLPISMFQPGFPQALHIEYSESRLKAAFEFLPARQPGILSAPRSSGSAAAPPAPGESTLKPWPSHPWRTRTADLRAVRLDDTASCDNAERLQRVRLHERIVSASDWLRPL